MRCAVLGSPIAHSLSPTLHRAAYAELGLHWRYDAIEVTEPELAGFVGGLGPEWRGLSLTMPLKRSVLPLLDEVSDTVVSARAANTVLLEPDGRRRGDNTDVPGMCAALAERGLDAPASALLLGGGATATSALVALSRLGCGDVTVAVRSPERAHELVAVSETLTETTVRLARVDELTPGRYDLLVTTIPAAAQEPLTALAAQAGGLFEVRYDPWPTPLAEAARVAGRPVVGGLDLLVHQAVGQVELMTGRVSAPLAAMRSALTKPVDASAQPNRPAG